MYIKNHPDHAMCPHLGAQCACHTPAAAHLNTLFSQKISRRGWLSKAAALGVAGGWSSTGIAAQSAGAHRPIAFTHARVFDGLASNLRDGLTVVVRGDRIETVRAHQASLGPDVQVVDCGGRTLMPGLIDAHWHTMLAPVTAQQIYTMDIGYLTILAAKEAERTLMRGFTSVRDMAGPDPVKASSKPLTKGFRSDHVYGPRAQSFLKRGDMVISDSPTRSLRRAMRPCVTSSGSMEASAQMVQTKC